MRPLAAAAALLLAVGCRDFDPEERRAARIDEYEIRDRTCEVVGDRLVATGKLISRVDEPQGFSVTVRFFDGEVDVGRPPIVNHPELIDPGDSWAWEASVETGGTVADPRCDVIQVAIGDDVDL